MLDCSIRSCFLSNQPLSMFPGHYVHLKMSLQDVATVWWEKQIGSLLQRYAVQWNKLCKASHKLVQPLMTYNNQLNTGRNGDRSMTTHVHHSFPVYFTHPTQMMSDTFVCGLHYFFAFIFEKPKSSLSNCAQSHRFWWTSSCRPTPFFKEHFILVLDVSRTSSANDAEKSETSSVFFKKKRKEKALLCWGSW